MITLCLDSAHKFLTIALYQDEKLLASVSKEAWKTQSELIFPELIRLMEEAGLVSEDIDQVVITDGPGSYTGVRIAMTVAKVFCTRMQKPLFTLSALRLYAGKQDPAFIMMDARSSRAYTGWVKAGQLTEEILTLDEVRNRLTDTDILTYGDMELIGRTSEPFDFVRSFIELKEYWKPVANIHTLVPRYLKDQDAYKAS